MADFFTSDTHFNHKNIIRYSNRPFSSVEEMNQELISRCIRKVGPKDTLYHVGDVCFGGEEILSQLKFRKVLILGNHDDEEGSKLQRYFDEVYRLYNFTNLDHKVKFVMCHYPFEVWPGRRKGAIHLHGHMHGTMTNLINNRMDVGVDCHPKYEPWSVLEILTHLRKQNVV